MPDPSKYDTEDEWMAACVPAVMDEGKTHEQAVGQCMGMWADHHDKFAIPTVTRAYSMLEVKSIDSEHRIIEGFATTPSVDRIGDIVDPLGAKFTLPIPLLYHHEHDQPVGHVVAARAGKDGISIKAKLAKVAEPGALKDRVELAWQEIKAGLVRGLSIGFRPREFEPLDQKDPFGGLRFSSWDWFELSLVTIPANADAQISVVRSIDQGLIAASGNGEAKAFRPGASGKSPVNLSIPKKGKMMSKTITEHLGALEAKRASLDARMNEIMAKAMEDGRSTDASEQEEFDGLERELEAIDADLVRFRRLEKSNAAAAKPVVAKTVDEGSAARGNDSRPYVRVSSPTFPPGIRFARIARCLAKGQGNRSEAASIAEQEYGADQEVTAVLKAAARFGQVSDLTEKAAVVAANSQESQWAGSLVAAAAGESGAVGDFLEFLRPQTIMGKFGVNGVPALRRVPFRTGLISQVSGGAAYWVAEAAPKPLTRFDLTRTTLSPLKVANIAVATDELIRDSSPSADGIIRDTLAAALRERLDIDFIDPANTGTAGSKPASITSGATAVMSGGAGGAGTGTAVQVRNDVRALIGQFQANNNDLANGVWIMRPTTAMNLSMMTNALGAPDPLVTGLTMEGGQFMGLPVIVSQYLPVTGSPVGDFVVLVDAQSVWLADEGGLAIDMSREASLEMLDASLVQTAGTGASPATSTGASLVSLWQVNCVGFRCERTINWSVARPGGVAVLTGGNWGE